MIRYGTHTEPPPREPGESLESWLSAIQAAVVLYPQAPRVAPAPIAAPKPPKRATVRKPQRAPKALPPKREPQRLGPAPLPLVPCPACGTGFKPYRVRRGRRQQFCSRACANQIANPRLGTIPCPVCATPFTPISCGAGKRKPTCSVACGHIRSGQSRQQLERMPCPACGKPFAPKSTGVGKNRKQFCSTACWRAGRAPVLPRDERGRWARAS